jgi:hypothetical protein
MIFGKDTYVETLFRKSGGSTIPFLAGLHHQYEAAAAATTTTTAATTTSL